MKTNIEKYVDLQIDLIKCGTYDKVVEYCQKNYTGTGLVDECIRKRLGQFLNPKTEALLNPEFNKAFDYCLKNYKDTSLFNLCLKKRLGIEKFSEFETLPTEWD